MGSKRHVKANNKYLKDYDRSKPSTYIMYWDANNLYGHAMCQCLPYRDPKLEADVPLTKILQTADDSNRGYIVECDLYYPPEIHDKVKEFVPCPETLTPDSQMFSDYQRGTAEKSGVLKK